MPKSHLKALAEDDRRIKRINAAKKRRLAVIDKERLAHIFDFATSHGFTYSINLTSRMMHGIVFNNDEECDGEVDEGDFCRDLINCNYCMEDAAVRREYGEHVMY